MTDTFWSGYGNALSAIQGVGGQITNRTAGARLGAGDYAGAAGALYNGGNLQGGMAVQAQGKEQEQAALAREIQGTLQITRALRKAQQAGQDLGQAFDSFAPLMNQLGLDPGSAGQLRTLVTTNPAALDQIEALAGQQAQQLQVRNAGSDVVVVGADGQEINRIRPSPQDYTIGTTRFSGANNEPVAQGYVAPEYIQRDPTKELVETTPGVAPVGRPSSAGASAPRGVRNNNPGNIEDGDFARSLPGYVGSDGRFAIFDSPEAGDQAAPRLLASYIQRGFDTPAEIINRWAPPSDNNPTQAYAQYVAQRVGIGPNDKVTPEQIPLLAQAIREFENGERPSSGQNVRGGSGPRVISAAAPSAGSSAGTLLTPDEVTAAGLAPGTVAQRTSTGQISILQAGPEAASRNRPTEAQNKDSFNANRMSDAGSIIGRLEQEGFDYGLSQATGGQLREGGRSYDAAAREWADSLLRLTTGAAATRDEVESALISYFPRPGDSPAVRQQKAQRRAQVERDALARGQGGAADRGQPVRQGAAAGGAGNLVQAPGLRFPITPQQSAIRQRVVSSGGSPRADLGGRQNPYYVNPSDPNGSYANVPRGGFFVTPDGTLRGPKP